MSSFLTFDYAMFLGEATLRCPACGESYLHHGDVSVYERSEDEPSGLAVHVEGKSARITADLRGNPSSRRHGLTIKFDCETCPARPTLAIAQHKGNTFVYWVE